MAHVAAFLCQDEEAGLGVWPEAHGLAWGRLCSCRDSVSNKVYSKNDLQKVILCLPRTGTHACLPLYVHTQEFMEGEVVSKQRDGLPVWHQHEYLAGAFPSAYL